jgi:hypothetical protein
VGAYPWTLQVQRASGRFCAGDWLVGGRFRGQDLKMNILPSDSRRPERDPVAARHDSGELSGSTWFGLGIGQAQLLDRPCPREFGAEPIGPDLTHALAGIGIIEEPGDGVGEGSS